MSTLTDQDQITSTHRGHGHAIAKGASFQGMFAELFGRVDGYCMGRGGSMHINDPTTGMLGANGIVGAGIPIAVGAAFANVYSKSTRVAITFFGDGTTNIGAFHEAANLAAVLRLPVVFVCENNGYSEFTPQSAHMLLEDVADRADAYGMAKSVCDGMDAFAVRQHVGEAVDRARRGDGPTLVEAKTYRFYDHQGVKGLRKPYRTQEEIDVWKLRDPIDLMASRLVEAGVVSADDVEALWKEAGEEAAEAISFAEGATQPDPADLLLNVYSGSAS
jgi:pyruvate dehydrogenase E1 component alpha subunit